MGLCSTLSLVIRLVTPAVKLQTTLFETCGCASNNLICSSCQSLCYDEPLSLSVYNLRSYQMSLHTLGTFKNRADLARLPTINNFYGYPHVRVAIQMTQGISRGERPDNYKSLRHENVSVLRRILVTITM